MLKLFGLIDVSNTELIGYALIFYGITIAYSSFGKNQPIILFLGSSLFLSGFLIFLYKNFEFTNFNETIFPAILLIAGINFFMLFMDNPVRKRFLAISLTSILSGIVVIFLLGSITFKNFSTSILNIAEKYWPIALIAAGLITLLTIEQKRNP